MKVLFVIVSLVVIASSEDDKKLNAELDSCAEKFPLEKDSYAKLLDPKADMPQDENLGCFLKCFYEKLQLVNKEGEMVALDKLLPEDSPLAKMSEECKSIKIKTCEDAIKFENCSHNAIKQLLVKQ